MSDLKVGTNRRVSDRRHEDLGGPPVAPPRHLEYTREEAIEELASWYVEGHDDFDSSDYYDLIVNGWSGTPLSKYTNKELALEIANVADLGDGETIKVGTTTLK